MHTACRIPRRGTRRNDARTVYLSGVFHVNVDDWRNYKEDRPSTPREVAAHFELDYTAWLEPRYRGVWPQHTHCWLFAANADVDARREKDLDDFRELGPAWWRPIGCPRRRYEKLEGFPVCSM